MKKRGQIALYVIVSLFLIGTVFLVYNFVVSPAAIPSELRPIDDRIKSCVANALDEGAMVLGEQGGYIIVPEFEVGSEVYPSTSQFNFFGSTMPLWFYVSGNGIERTQVPSISGMEVQLENYLNEALLNCDFSDFTNQGYFVISSSDPSTKITIEDSSITAEVEWPVTASLGETSRRITSYNVKTNNNLGKMYETAKMIFDSEDSEKFLEEYAIDSITLNAPTTDTVISCAPLIWSKQQISSDIKDSLALNLPTLKFSGDYFSVSENERRYFVKNLNSKIVNQKVHVFYSSNFPTYIEVSPSTGDIMRADPIGLQKGMEALGFCYVPYHYVYSMNFPVIVQVFDENDKLFQFSTLVQIVNNHPRGYVAGEQPVEDVENQICAYKPQEFEVRTVDEFGNLVDSEISLRCAGASCPIGQTINGVLNSGFPQCVNGFIEARKEGYATTLAQVSTDIPGSIEIPMNKLYTLELNVLANFNQLRDNDTALLTFTSADYVSSVYYPLQNEIILPRGNYEITAYLFRSGRIQLGAQTTQNCVDVPRDGISGLLGFKTTQCFDINTPAQELDQITIGGGNLQREINNQELLQSNIVEISIPAYTQPTNAQELQEIYSIVEQSSLNIMFR